LNGKSQFQRKPSEIDIKVNNDGGMANSGIF
jgi:hypothetical protein